MENRPYAESCDQNREPIRQVLNQFVEGKQSVLEIGSGTGQHAVYFAHCYPWLNWQTSDLKESHQGIKAWIDHCGLKNIAFPIELDAAGVWPQNTYDLLYTANTIHIMSQKQVTALFDQCVSCMHDASLLLMYGPFNYEGMYTSDSNAQFDAWLKQRDSLSGIKNYEWLQQLGENSGISCINDYEMPANNRILVWKKM